jgi:hypothetical protein
MSLDEHLHTFASSESGEYDNNVSAPTEEAKFTQSINPWLPTQI